MKDIHNTPPPGWRIEGSYWIRESDGLRLPVVTGGTSANTIQTSTWAFGTDNGTESGHSLDTEGANRTAQQADVTFLIRLQAHETAGKTDPWAFQLYAAKNGGATFTAVDSSRTDGIIKANDTQSRSDGEATTERLTAPGTGTWLAGEYDDGTTSEGTGTIGLNGNYTEIEFAIQIDSTYASDGDYWDLRLESTSGGDLVSYGTLPRVTASILAPVEVTPSAAVAGADSVNPSVRLGSISDTPSALVASADSLVGEVRQGSISVSPTLADAGADSVDPSVYALTYIRPSTDNLLGNWTDEGDGTTNIYLSIDEVTISDADYIQSGSNPSTDIYRTKLQSASDPLTSGGHFVNYRYRKNPDVGTINLIVRLKEGTTTVRASWTHNNITNTWVTASQELSTAEADSITDYTNLYLEFEATAV